MVYFILRHGAIILLSLTRIRKIIAEQTDSGPKIEDEAYEDFFTMNYPMPMPIPLPRTHTPFSMPYHPTPHTPTAIFTTAISIAS